MATRADDRAVEGSIQTSNEKSSDHSDKELEQPTLVSEPPNGADESMFLSGTKLILVSVALLLATFLVNLDQTIVATALPRIVSVFGALDSATWVAAAYFLTEAGLMLSIGQLVKTIPVKPVYLLSILLFEVGSVLCGAAPSMEVLIFGRAIAGWGAAGIIICSIATISNFTRLEHRPVLFGCFGALMAISSIVGPLLGGAFTDHVSWRWCFYINLPIGAISIAVMFLWLPYRRPEQSEELAGKSTLARLNITLDWVGTVMCLGFATCLLLALNWGGIVKPWGSADVIVPLVLLGTLIPVFLLWERRRGVHALVPLWIFKRRTQAGACLVSFFLLTSLIVSVYYLPFWYQINGRTSVESGIDILPLMLSYVVATVISSALISYTGRYWLILILSPLLTVVGSSLLYTIDARTAHKTLIGYQILVGAGIGGSFQGTYLAVQAEWVEDIKETAGASSILTFLGFLGSIIGLGICGSLYNNRLGGELAKIPGLPEVAIEYLKQSVTVIAMLPEPIRSEVQEASVIALRPIFLIPVACAALASASAIAIKNHNMHERAKLIPEGQYGAAVAH